MGMNYPGYKKHYEKTKFINNKNRSQKRNPVRGMENSFNKVIEENFSNLKKEVTIKL